mmetsp:Transcript_18608/g.21378  ORF Transcript_18608/g.21378 Transcript_18608/m.21378 type:complete len:129 (-) Transcript_18608:33-419(-)
MKHIIRNKSVLSCLDKPIENLKRAERGVTFDRDVLRTYRDVLKVTARYNWNNENGEPWKMILRVSARAEFEAIKEEIDPLIVGKFIITWKDTIIRMHEKVNDVNMKMAKFVEETRTDNAHSKVYDPFK